MTKRRQKVAKVQQDAPRGLTGGRKVTNPIGTTYPEPVTVADVVFDRLMGQIER